jgi:hypothetical protein
MNATTLNPQTPSLSLGMSIQQQVDDSISDLLASLPDPKKLSAEQRRGIIARYSAVLEGNFIYWMTGALLSVRSEQARSIILDNLHEEVRDSHPEMLRRFTLAAHAFPTDSDAMAVHRDLTKVRLFVGRLSTVQLVIMMGFFEGFIQKFMSFLAYLAGDQGSVEREYTDVHGVCDIAHTEGLFRALDSEISLNPPDPEANLFEGVELLSSLIRSIVQQTATNNGSKPI